MTAFLDDDTLHRLTQAVLAAHPEQEAIIRAFLPLLRTRNRILREAATSTATSAASATPTPLESLQAVLEAVAEGLPSMAESLRAVAARLDAAQCDSLLRGDAPAEASASDECRDVLRFALLQTRKLLAALRAANLPEATDALQRRTCPYCGGAPELSVIHTSEGQRHLVCGQCGRCWRFKRLACPACGVETAGNLHSLHVEARPEERGVFCTACNHYILELDIRHLDMQPEHCQVLALGLGALDVLMQREGKQPLATTGDC